MYFSSIVIQFYCCKLHNRNLGCSGRRWQALYYAFASCSLQEHKHQVFLPLSTTKFCGVQCLPREFTLKLENGDILNSMSFIDHHEHRAPRAPVAKIKSIYVSPLSISLSYPVSKTWYNLRPRGQNKPQYKTSVTKCNVFENINQMLRLHQRSSELNMSPLFKDSLQKINPTFFKLWINFLKNDHQSNVRYKLKYSLGL